jgi:hypothetical protein
LSPRQIFERRRARHALGVLASLALAVGALAIAVLFDSSGASSSAIAQASSAEGGEVTPQTDASVPATHVTLIGAAPKEAADETWGLGVSRGGASVLVRYATESGWSLGPGLLNSSGEPLSGFKLDQPEAFRFSEPSVLAGQMTENGSGVMGGEAPVGGGGSPSLASKLAPTLLVRNPGGAFQETAALPTAGEVALGKGERLLGVERAPMLAALEEANGHTGALVVPVNEEHNDSEDRVLHWNGEAWTSEAIEVPTASKGEFEVLAIGASSPSNAWLLAKLSSHGAIGLFRRKLGSGSEASTWQPVAPKPGGELGEALKVPTAGEEVPFTVPSNEQSQILTVTTEGVWIDGERADVQASATMFFKPESETQGRMLESWCTVSGNEPSSIPACGGELPETLPTAGGRSFAWAGGGSSGFGQRVITGFSEGVSLRLEGDEFKRVLALGSSVNTSEDVGSTFGAAFSGPREGWLGQLQLPVHLTTSPVKSLLNPWPAPFRHALLALAPAPAAAVGSLSSEALAVGDEGEVARYSPSKGWLPESLLGPGGRHETPRLRAVAWPTPERAYAVGDRGQMWLWRGETGLWEPDPAEPLNFRGNLLGVAFDPEEPALGYAVGESGALLRYGKTWSQEPEAAIPQQARGASFTAIVFAGSEAIVAYRRLIPSTERFEGGLIVNDGTGWHLDEGAAAAMGATAPWALAALPEGAAAFSTRSGQVFERQGGGSPWQETATPYPGELAPGTIALFREGGALRVVTAGSEPDTTEVESEPSPPAGFPPNLVQPYPLASSQESSVLRQTATGWSDEEHELNNVQEPPGAFKAYDAVYRPDPVAAVMVDPTGSQGWAVGGIVGEVPDSPLDTADVWRYPAGTGEEPVGVHSEAITSESIGGGARFAIGGGAQCAAPCAARAKAHIGPDVWLEHALEEAGKNLAGEGIQAFIDTGPRVTSGETVGPATVAVPYPRELDRYAEILGGGVRAFAAISQSELDTALEPARAEEPFAQALSGLQGASTHYATTLKGVRVIVLDTTYAEENPAETQPVWLGNELANAAGDHEPAIVVGNADLQTQINAGSQTAREILAVMIKGGASAYFFDSPEKNVKLALEIGPGESIPTYGSGTLGYINSNEQAQSDFIGASGFLLTEVGAPNERNIAPVHVSLIPDIGELALEAEQGTLLRRSQPARFQALARRPRAGGDAFSGSRVTETDPYIPIPLNCVGAACAEGLQPEYTFSSSNPSVGAFVEQDSAEPNGLEPMLSASGGPILETAGKSGLFCAFNPGTTTVTISAGGLSYSLPVSVQAGSVRQPCGTVPATKTPNTSQAVAPPPPPPPSPAPAGAAPTSSAPLSLPIPPPPLAVTLQPAVHRPPPPYFLTPVPPGYLLAFVPPPVPTPARPTPPSGTSAVTSPVEAAEREEESEAAPESVSNEAVAYSAPEHEPTPAYILGIVVLAAFAGASIRKRPRRSGRRAQIAPATISTMRSQRQVAPRRERFR